MKRYRRIEITAFRRRISIVSDWPDQGVQAEEEVHINDLDSSKIIELGTLEGQRILTEVVRLLEGKLSGSDSRVE